MHKKIFGLALMAAAFVPAMAHAQNYTYTFSSPFDAPFSFTLDPGAALPGNMRDATAVHFAAVSITSATGLASGDVDFYSVMNGGGFNVSTVGYFSGGGTQFYQGSIADDGTPQGFSLLTGDFFVMSSGEAPGFVSVTTASSAVPEPATWAMMLAGFGMTGFAARRRVSKKTTVTFA